LVYVEVIDYYSPENNWIELQEYLKDNNGTSILIADNIFRQVLDAVIHLFGLKIAHADIKRNLSLILAQNILINTNSFKIKLIDYDISQIVISGEDSTFYGGTKLFFSPEIVLKIPYSLEKNTVWQLGCLLYVLYFHRYPFYHNSDIVYKNIERDLLQYDLNKYPYKGIQFMGEMLSKQPNDRPYLHELDEFD
jgi:serine/threonine protein kinase